MTAGVITKSVQFINREKCARPYTFLLEISRPAQPGDADNLIMKTNGIETTIEYVSLCFRFFVIIWNVFELEYNCS